MSELASGMAPATPAPSAAPEAPASAAPSAGPPAPAAASDAPITSLSDAFSRFGVGEETPEASTPDAPPPEGSAPATAEPVGAPVEATPSKEGPIPFAVHKTALENARTKEREAVLGDVRKELGPALSVVQQLQSDPVGTITRLVAELQQHPEYGPQLKSHAAKVLGQRQPTATRDEAAPAPDLQTADGQLLYSAEQMAKREQWQAAQLRKELQQQMSSELASVREIVQERQAVKARDQYVEQAVRGYQPYVTELQAMPGFTEHRAEIVARQKALFDEATHAGQSVDPLALVFRAYREIVPAKLQAQREQQLVATATAKAAGRDSNPAVAVGSPPPSPRSMAEALRQVGLGAG